MLLRPLVENHCFSGCTGSIRCLFLWHLQYAWAYHSPRGTAEQESAETNLQHLCLRRHQRGAQTSLPASGVQTNCLAWFFTWTQITHLTHNSAFMLMAIMKLCFCRLPHSPWQQKCFLEMEEIICWLSKKESGTKCIKGIVNTDDF